MNKLDKIIKKAEDLYRKSLWSYFMIKNAAEAFVMPDDEEELDSGESELSYNAKDPQSILAAAESLSYDIINENLLTQFDLLVNSYRSFLNSLSVSPNDLDEDAQGKAEQSAQETGEIAATLNSRYERLMNNGYLNLSPDDPRWEESFPGFKVMELAQAMFKSAEDLFRSRAGDDSIGIQDIGILNIQNEVKALTGDLQEDAENKRRNNVLGKYKEYQKEYFRKLMEAAKFGETHKQWQAYQNRLESKRNEFAAIKSDPERYKKYRVEATKRQSKHSNFDKRLSEAELELSRTRDPEERMQLESLIQKIKKSKDRFHTKNVDIAARIKAKKESKELDGLIIHLSQKLASLKNDTAKVVKNKLKKDPKLQPYKDAINAAEKAASMDPSPANQKALENAKRQEYDFVVNYLNNHETVNKVKEDIAMIYPFRDECKKIDESGLLNNDHIDPNLLPIILQLITYGEKVNQNYAQKYKGISATIREILDYLKTRVQ